MVSSHNFYVIGDPQIGHATQEERMAKKTADLVRLDDRDGVVIIPGDLTNKGFGSMDPFTKYLCMCFCVRRARGEIKGGKNKNELAEFHEKYVVPLENASRAVLTCIGNHDSLTQWWTGHNPAYGYVKDRHGGLVYEREIDGIVVYSLSEWPKKRTVDWLASKLATHTKPFVLFFHYNLEGAYSDWWKPSEKEYLYEIAIRPHKNRIAFIAEGHYHASYVKKWRGVTVVNGGGNSVIKVRVDVGGEDSNALKVQATAVV